MQINPTKLVGLFAVSAVLLSAAVLVCWFLFGRGLNSDVRRMLQTMSTIKTMTIKTEWADASVSRVPFFPPPAEEFSVHVGSQGQVDLTDKTKPSFAQTFAINTSVEDGNPYGEYRDIAGTRYLYLANAPVYGDVDLSAFEKQWIIIPDTFSFAALSGGDWLRDVTEDDVNDLSRLLGKIDLVDASKTGGVEVIDGDAALPYTFTIDKEGMTVFLATLWEMRHGTAIDPQTFQAMTDQIAAWGSGQGTLWIGRKSFLLHRLTFSTTDQTLEINVSDFNQPVSIEAPHPNASITEALGKLGFNVAALPTSQEARAHAPIGATSSFGSLPGNTASAAEEDTDPDKDGLGNGFEFFYGTDPTNPDTDGDGVNDGEEVEHSSNPRGSGSIFSFGLPQ